MTGKTVSFKNGHISSIEPSCEIENRKQHYIKFADKKMLIWDLPNQYLLNFQKTNLLILLSNLIDHTRPGYHAKDYLQILLNTWIMEKLHYAI